MANHASALKKIRQNDKLTTRNRWWKSRIRFATKQVLDFCEAKDKKSAAIALTKAESEISKAQSKGVIHKNTAARKISNLAGHCNKI